MKQRGISMKNGKKIFILFCISVISFSFISTSLGYTSLDEQSIENISFVCVILFVIMYILITKNEEKNVILNSKKIQMLINLNESYQFKDISQNNHRILEQEYSRKSLNRVTASSIIKYHIENDMNSLRTDIENAIYNLELLEKYKDEVREIRDYESVNETKYSFKKYQRIENRVFKNLVYKREDFLIRLKLKAYYRSNSGRVNESKYGKFDFQELLKFYNEWQNGNKFEETKKQERKIMNDDIRYNVLKRDHYACKICGATAQDGAKLHVDHIIPVSKGGKTVMSNLQTLCDRCNIGKSNKVDESFLDNMICPECGSALVIRKGKFGKFIGCSNYPSCHYTK